MIDEALRTSGDVFALKRFYKYTGTVEWKFHSTYMSVDIYRAYHLGNGRPAGLYAVNIDNNFLLVGDTLDNIKARVREWVQ